MALNTSTEKFHSDTDVEGVEPQTEPKKSSKYRVPDEIHNLVPIFSLFSILIVVSLQPKEISILLLVLCSSVYLALTLRGKSTWKRDKYTRGLMISSLAPVLYVLGVLLWRLNWEFLNNSISWAILGIAVLLILFEWGHYFGWFFKYVVSPFTIRVANLLHRLSGRRMPRSPKTIMQARTQTEDDPISEIPEFETTDEPKSRIGFLKRIGIGSGEDVEDDSSGGETEEKESL